MNRLSTSDHTPRPSAPVGASRSSPRVLVVAADPILAYTRAALVQAAGFASETTRDGESAIHLLQREKFDLVLLGHEATNFAMEAEKRLRESFPGLLLLKIESMDAAEDQYASRTTDHAPSHVVAALRAMLGDFSPLPYH